MMMMKNIESTLSEVKLLTKRNFICGSIYKYPHKSIADFNLTYLTPPLEKFKDFDSNKL